MTVDVGTGDGRAVLAAAAREPKVLAIGLDADASSMAEVSRRAARSEAKGGSANVAFLVAAAEAIPAELHGIAALVTVRFPWASLLRGCLGADPAVAGGVARLVASAGELELLLAPSDRDRLAGLPTEAPAVIAAARAAFEALGLCFTEGRPATSEEIRASGSTWGRRLLGNPAARTDRRPVIVRFRRPARNERTRSDDGERDLVDFAVDDSPGSEPGLARRGVRLVRMEGDEHVQGIGIEGQADVGEGRSRR